MQNRETFSGLGQCGRRPPLVSKCQPPKPGERRGQDEADSRCDEEVGARPQQNHVLGAVDNDTPAERGQPAIGGEVHLTVDGVLQLRHAVVTLEQTPNHRNVDIVGHVLGAGPRAVIHELPLTVDDEDVAAGDLDRQQPCAERVQALHRDDDADDRPVDVADGHGERHRRRVAEVGLIHL